MSHITEPIAVLLIEDQPSDSALVQAALQASREPFTVTACASLHEAVNHLQTFVPAAILLDLGLPESFGIETLITVLGWGFQIPVYVITGDCTIGGECMRQGAEDFSPKEFDQRNIQDAGKLLSRMIISGNERYSLKAQVLAAKARQTGVAEEVAKLLVIAARIKAYASEV